jgi:uncharacterized protein YndB with AHSA1/START domain
MSKTNLQQHIFIDALPTKVWKVLTAPDYVDQYLLDGTLRCQWIEGSPLTLVRENEGKVETLHKGNTLQVVPGVLLKYNLNEENSENFTTVTYHLSPAENGIELKYSAEGFNDTDEDYFLRIKQTKLLLQKIKWLAEYA